MPEPLFTNELHADIVAGARKVKSKHFLFGIPLIVSILCCSSAFEMNVSMVPNVGVLLSKVARVRRSVLTPTNRMGSAGLHDT